MTHQPPEDRQVDVVHSVEVWLNQTVTWLYTLVTSQPEDIRNHVICRRLKNLDQFPFADMICLEEDVPPWRRLNSLSWKVRTWREGRRSTSFIRSRGARILHSHFGNQGWANLGLARRNGLKHVVTFYGFDAGRLPQDEPVWKERYLEMFHEADLFLCEGPHLGEHLTRLGCPREKVVVQHLGVDLGRIPFRVREWSPGETLKVLLAGSFVEKKGLPYAVRALGGIKGRVPLSITIIGDDNGEERSLREKAAIEAAIAETGLESSVRRLGYQPYSVLLEEAGRNHIFLSPSVASRDGDTEGGAPVTIIEMAASGMPVVSTTHCDIPEVLADGRTGLMAAERDVAGLVAKLTWLLDHPDRWPALGTAARRHVEAEFDATIQGDRLGAHYRRLARS